MAATLIEHQCCVMVQDSASILARKCLKAGTVPHGESWYCWVHDPRRNPELYDRLLGVRPAHHADPKVRKAAERLGRVCVALQKVKQAPNSSPKRQPRVEEAYRRLRTAIDAFTKAWEVVDRRARTSCPACGGTKKVRVCVPADPPEQSTWHWIECPRCRRGAAAKAGRRRMEG